jgi:orotate phosphoribosyltransferase
MRNNQCQILIIRSSHLRIFAFPNHHIIKLSNHQITKFAHPHKPVYVCRMPHRDDTALKIAEQLLQIKAIKLQPSQPFTWASGWKSPIYCDNRISLSYPKVRTFIRQALVKSIGEKFGKPDVIAGVATAAIAQGALVAEAMGLPFVYVRSSPKDHGRENLIEGEVKPGQSVVVIEDLISTGQSSLKAVNALREADCKVSGMISIFTYGFKTATDNFKKEKCPVHSLCNYDVLIEKALETKYVTDNDLKTLKAWRDSPDTWGK